MIFLHTVNVLNPVPCKVCNQPTKESFIDLNTKTEVCMRCAHSIFDAYRVYLNTRQEQKN